MSARRSDPQTSHEASRTRSKADVAGAILATLRKRPSRGFADFELEEIVCAKTGVTPQRVRTVRASLTKPIGWSTKGQGFIGYTWLAPRVEPIPDTYRTTPTGRRAQVYKVAS